MNTMPNVSQCASLGCSFNHNGCNAPAMTMGEKGCVTFVQISTRPTDDREAHVGACQRIECAFNDHLACSAEAVEVGSDHAECLTFQPA